MNRYIMTDLEGTEWAEVDQSTMDEARAQRVPHTENLTYGELTGMTSSLLTPNDMPHDS